MQKTDIEYLTHTWNPIAMRCSETSSGCRSCWHLKMANRLSKNPLLPVAERLALAGGNPFVLRTHKLADPMKTKKPAVIGVQFMGDLFHEDVPLDFIRQVYFQMNFNYQHTYLILTKRADRMAEITNLNPGRLERAKIYHGLTVCNQQEADEKISIFLQVPGRKLLSIEPMLSAINLHLTDVVDNSRNAWGVRHNFINAVILGGETGSGARPMHPDWARSVRDQCEAADVPFFFKQWGEWAETGPVSAKKTAIDRSGRKAAPGILRHHFPPDAQAADGWSIMYRVGRKNSGRCLDEKFHDDLPWAKP